MAVYRDLPAPTLEPATALTEETQMALIGAVAKGELVVLPTDTVYGIGTDPFSLAAATRLLGAKGRDESMPPPILGGIFEELLSLVTFPNLEARDSFLALAEAFWPGPLTIVAEANVEFGWDLSEVGGTVALRMPADTLALEALRVTGPMAVTSANRTGMAPARTIGEAREYFGDEVAVYIDGGHARDGSPSTIVDCSRQELRVLRAGTLTKAQIQQVLESK